MPDSPNDSKLKIWLWVLGGLVVVLVIALVVVLVVRDDDSNEADSTTTTTSSTTTSTTTTTAPATTTTAPPTSTTLPYPAITDDPGTYAQYLFVAWQNNSQVNAANVASAEAIQQMFSQPYSASAGWTAGTCDPAAGSLYCPWTASNGAKLTMQVRTLTGGLPIQVTGVTRS
ncbi:MAG: hypothetical protein U0W40_02815 [Acidimicrobiia bacterium]